MIVFEAVRQNEAHAVYQRLESDNGSRTYSFLEAAIRASIDLQQCYLSTAVIKAINFHAVACLHAFAGQVRQHRVVVHTTLPTGEVKVDFVPPDPYRVSALLDDLVNVVNRRFEQSNPALLAAFVLWRLCWIHPFENGNGRTARAACYFVFCVRVGGLLPGRRTLPELLTANRAEMIQCLREVDSLYERGDEAYLQPVATLIERLVMEQLSDVQDDVAHGP